MRLFLIGGGIKDGKKFKAVQTGYPSVVVESRSTLILQLTIDNLVAAGSMMGSGGMIVPDEENCMVAATSSYLEFTVEESCGVLLKPYRKQETL